MDEPVRTLALFDLDGTLTDRDTFLDVLLFGFGRLRTVAGLLVETPFLAGYAMGIFPAARAKERMFTRFFGGMSRERFLALASEYSIRCLPARFRPGALAQVRRHRADGHDVYIVSASIRQWIGPWAEREGIRVIATEPEIADGRLTGRFATPNCRGAEKVRRIRESIRLSAYGRVYAYGDSPHDRPMLALATDPVYRPFRSGHGSGSNG